MTEALLLPEIISIVLEHLEDEKAALRSAIRVCKAWAERGTDVLWHSPRPSALAAIAEDRRQYYANKIAELDFYDDTDGQYHAIFKDLRFPRLDFICLHPYQSENDQHFYIEQYLQSNLETLSWVGGPTEDLLDMIETRCPGVRYIYLEGEVKNATPARLLQFLEKCKRLRGIDLGSDICKASDEGVLGHLATRPGLDQLSIYKPFDVETVEMLFRGAHPNLPFQTISELEIDVQSAAISPLKPALTCLKRLCLQLEDNTHDTFTVIGSLINLHRLALIFKESKTLSQNELLTLGQLRQLRELDLRFKDDAEYRDLKAYDVTDEDMDHLFTSLPNLESLSFKVQNKLTIQSLNSIGLRCQLLRDCKMFGQFDLETWGADMDAKATILFPNLKTLEVDGLPEPYQPGEQNEKWTDERAWKIVHCVMYHAPKSEVLLFTHANEFGWKVFDFHAEERKRIDQYRRDLKSRTFEDTPA